MSCKPSRVSKVSDTAKPSALPWERVTSENMPKLRRHLLLYDRNGVFAHGMCLKKDQGVLVDGVTQPLSRFTHFLTCTKPE